MKLNNATAMKALSKKIDLLGKEDKKQYDFLVKEDEKKSICLEKYFNK
jgi:hypothetical protein